MTQRAPEVGDGDSAGGLRVGFIGLGTMGQPMALNLVRSLPSLVVWNRSPERIEPLRAAGARVAASAAELFDATDVVLLMLADGDAADAVLLRGTPDFAARVGGRTIVQMSTVAPEYSLRLGMDITEHGGRYVEATVSGSRGPAQAGQLVAMVAGEGPDLEVVGPLMGPMCREVVACGAVPKASMMKLSVNVFLITTVTGLAEAFNFAREHDLDLDRFVAVLDAGPMASSVSRGKGAKLLRGEFEAEASISNVLYNNRLITEEARRSGVPSPLIDVCFRLFGEAEALGLGRADMAAVVEAVAARTDALTSQ